MGFLVIASFQDFPTRHLNQRLDPHHHPKALNTITANNENYSCDKYSYLFFPKCAGYGHAKTKSPVGKRRRQCHCRTQATPATRVAERASYSTNGKAARAPAIIPNAMADPATTLDPLGGNQLGTN